MSRVCYLYDTLKPSPDTFSWPTSFSLGVIFKGQDMNAQLPQEIIDMINDRVRETPSYKESLVSIRSVSRAWSQSADRLLYHDIKLGEGIKQGSIEYHNLKQDYLKHRILSTNEYLAGLVRNIHLKVIRENVRLCIGVLALCRNVIEVEIQIGSICMNDENSLLKCLGGLCGTLKTLRINGQGGCMIPEKLFLDDCGRAREWPRLEVLDINSPQGDYRNAHFDLERRLSSGLRPKTQGPYSANVPSLRRLSIYLGRPSYINSNTFPISVPNPALSSLRLLHSWSSTLQELTFYSFTYLSEEKTIPFPVFPSIVPAGLDMKLTSTEPPGITKASISDDAQQTRKLERLWLGGFITFDIWKELKTECKRRGIEFEFSRRGSKDIGDSFFG
ncbi:hypothetical protein PNOK_0848200 [Pyrrhoderma noxium]|uniref:Uncharacterized protein n=1 Tax=Pyrrhoderma noxium TaxID=2282107 RepID=A0A286U7Z1_9AGAM|nr:hypothetical protein PNOK_0848200 [Pyrrhoderma noxium]